jgi:hypothetical protein
VRQIFWNSRTRRGAPAMRCKINFVSSVKTIMPRWLAASLPLAGVNIEHIRSIYRILRTKGTSTPIVNGA